MDVIQDNRSAARRTLLTLETERALDDPHDSFVKISIRVDNDGVLATHFSNDALHLASME